MDTSHGPRKPNYTGPWLVHQPWPFLAPGSAGSQRDSGILHAFLDIEDYDTLLANPVAGASWEGFVLENIIAEHHRWQPSYVRTTNGAEIDLLLERSGRRHLFECKLSKAPKPSRGFYELTDSMQPEAAWVIAPVDEPYEIGKNIVVCPPGQYKPVSG